MTNEKKPVKNCPFQQSTQYQPDVSCVTSCALWIPRGALYTTENIPAEGMCAITAIALKNQEGQIQV